jgi:trans-2,3-dihydro-3-hydroxyanthranilate isomerase
MYRYLHLDVFTDTSLEGNQLAVYPEPAGLTDAMMQKIAQEMNFSETTFVWPKEGRGDVRMRIFTPGRELAMAGHPTIGTTFALAAEGTIERGRREFVFELGVGPIPVALEWEDEGLSFAWMTQGLPEFGATITDRDRLAAAIGVQPRDVVPDVPAQIVSCGVPFLFVALASRAAVDTVAIDRRGLSTLFGASGVEEHAVFFFTTERTRDAGGETVYSRMLAPSFGITEDPATGGASGPLGCYLLHYGLVTAETARNMISLQGVAMGRPSRVHIAIESSGGSIGRVQVGGKSVIVGSGHLVI